LSEAALASPALRATLGGRVLLAERSFDMQGSIAGLLADGGMGSGLPFDLVGSWDDASIGPNVHALIQRSGAAAPLLNLPPPAPPAALSLDTALRRSTP
jgi:AsmA protein